MKKHYGIIIAAAVLVIIGVYAALAVLILPKFFRSVESNVKMSKVPSVEAKKLIPAKVCTTAPNNSIAVFNFRYSGDADAKFYAPGFARALAERVNCAPTCITQQPNSAEVLDSLSRIEAECKTPPSDSLAIKANRYLYAKYLLTGDFKLSGGKASIFAYLIDTSANNKKITLKTEGTLADLPKMQTNIAKQISSIMKLKLSNLQSAEIGKPNFSKPDVLKLYGQSFLAKDMKITDSLRWKAVEVDPNSVFAAVRLLEHYYYGDTTGPEIASDAKLQSYLPKAMQKFACNSLVELDNTLLISKQSHFQKAQAALEKLIKHDSNYARAHAALFYVEQSRGDADFSMREANAAESLWKNNANYHVMLADAYNLVSENARHSHYFSEISQSAENIWYHNSNKCFTEAMTAVKLDPDNYNAWCEVMSSSLGLGFDYYHEKAYKERIRICPKDLNSYLDNLISNLPQWGGSRWQREKLMSDAENALGKDSADIYVYKANEVIRLYNPPSGHPQPSDPECKEFLKYAELANSKCKTMRSDVLALECDALMDNHKYDDFFVLAEKCYKKWGNTYWLYRYGIAYEHRYEEKQDISALHKAKDIFANYIQEVPFATEGYDQLGWCLSHLGHRAEAKQMFLKALKIDPADRIAREKMKYVQ